MRGGIGETDRIHGLLEEKRTDLVFPAPMPGSDGSLE